MGLGTLTKCRRLGGRGSGKPGTGWVVLSEARVWFGDPPEGTGRVGYSSRRSGMGQGTLS